MPPFDHFDFLAPIYDRMMKSTPQVDLLEHLNINSRSSVLDVGGGTGRVAQTLIPHAASVTVVDLSFNMLREARLKPGLNGVMAGSEHLPYEESSFDVVLMVDAFHHVIDQSLTLREMFRVVKPGRSLVVEEPDINTFLVKLVAFGEKLLGMRSHFLSGEEIAGLLKTFCNDIRIYRKEYIVWVVVKK